MTAESIGIRNIYVMMAYAFRTVDSSDTAPVLSEEFDHLHDLLAHILERGVATQIKRGLHRDYQSQIEEVAGVRGRIDMAQTVSTRSMTRGRLVCRFDEYDADTLHNQALKSVLLLLARHSEVSPDRRKAIRRLLPHLAEVTDVAPQSIRWNSLNFHRANAPYRLLLGVCELIVHGLLLTEHAGETKLATWFSTEEMSSLYERFLREYFLVHHPELSPSAPHISWDYADVDAIGTDQLPRMKTDLTLERDGHTLIVDAKFYDNTMQVAWKSNKPKVHSGHLYQILAYAKNQDVKQDGSVSALLLYARTAAVLQPDLDVLIQKTRISARTLDLSLPWEQVREQLEAVAARV
ncbi:5-methylcytosine-specific restriction endonuclease system specificity protein McrC [Salinibacterium sp. SWN139]|uniref:5-methylcytosine-specific restriction endonuclease system specificity protein McrC n=1 Tax=Salinibacterium sp. SWN139 TaxID=2792055 RepID=UPI0018CD8B55|nr:5-methylcytosine-specific restriction endonuclease system specificity protein McrC [Salinibacterium sp. SWN139]MBH0054662.1 5-methylcytosine-specific restriction endonuclease system specificity protein McrC [Salinibacterium sp. SWN139]